MMLYTTVILNQNDWRNALKSPDGTNAINLEVSYPGKELQAGGD